MDYVVTGLNMLDVLEYPDGTRTAPQMGGIPMYGYCGMRPWTGSILFAGRVGRDFYDIYDPWFTQNRIDPRGLTFVSEETPYSVVLYNEAGNSAPGPFFTGSWDDSDFWRPKPQDFAGKLEGTKGFYLTSGPPPEEIWSGLFDLQAAHGFKIMWEPNGRHTRPEDGPAVTALCRRIQMASFNVPEAQRIFGIGTEEALVEFLKTLGPELVLLRAGAKGLYAIHDQKAWFVPSTPLGEGEEVVDVTGCGNAATAGACCAWCEGNDPIMTGIMANISAYYNLRQKGPWPLFDDALTAEAAALAHRLRAAYDRLPL